MVAVAAKHMIHRLLTPAFSFLKTDGMTKSKITCYREFADIVEDVNQEVKIWSSEDFLELIGALL